jgi:hypothetical protein
MYWDGLRSACKGMQLIVSHNIQPRWKLSSLVVIFKRKWFCVKKAKYDDNVQEEAVEF